MSFMYIYMGIIFLPCHFKTCLYEPIIFIQAVFDCTSGDVCLQGFLPESQVTEGGCGGWVDETFHPVDWGLCPV